MKKTGVIMLSLKEKKCEICLFDSPKLTSKQFELYQDQLLGWNKIVVDNLEQISKTFVFKNFEMALNFTNQVGEIAEKQNHHPTILIEWGKVTITWWTHVIKGLHLNDLIMAAKTDAIYRHHFE